MLDQLSATVRPNRRNKTDRKDLHGGGGGGAIQTDEIPYDDLLIDLMISRVSPRLKRKK